MFLTVVTHAGLSKEQTARVWDEGASPLASRIENCTASE